MHHISIIIMSQISIFIIGVWLHLHLLCHLDKPKIPTAYKGVQLNHDTKDSEHDAMHAIKCVCKMCWLNNICTNIP